MNASAEEMLESLRNGDAVRVGTLLRQGTDPNLRGERGITSLHYAAIMHQIGIAEVLLDNGANVNARADDGDTPLVSAVYAENQAMVELLLRRGANVNMRGEGGKTALRAVPFGCVQIARLLLEKGADPRIQDDDGFTPLHVATARRDIEMITLLHEQPRRFPSRGLAVNFAGSKTIASVMLIIPAIALIGVFAMRLPPRTVSSATFSFYGGTLERATALGIVASVHLLFFSLAFGLAWFIGRLLGKRPYILATFLGIVAVLLDSELTLSLSFGVAALVGGVVGWLLGRGSTLSRSLFSKKWFPVALLTFLWDFLKEGIWAAFVAPQTVGAGSYHLALILTVGVCMSYAYFLRICLFPKDL